jgi:hypothetical protein
MSLTSVITVGSPTAMSLDDIEGNIDVMLVVLLTWANMSLVPICAETLQNTEDIQWFRTQKIYNGSEQVAPTSRQTMESK